MLLMGKTPKSRSSTTKGHWRETRMFKREFNSSKHAEMGALAAVASKDCSGGKANKTQQVTPLVATEEFICVSLYYLHLHFT